LGKIKKNTLVWDAGSARHKEFSFNQFIAIVVLRTEIEVGDG
jgi:hypothetical protein